MPDTFNIRFKVECRELPISPSCSPFCISRHACCIHNALHRNERHRWDGACNICAFIKVSSTALPFIFDRPIPPRHWVSFRRDLCSPLSVVRRVHWLRRKRGTIFSRNRDSRTRCIVEFNPLALCSRVLTGITAPHDFTDNHTTHGIIGGVP